MKWGYKNHIRSQLMLISSHYASRVHKFDSKMNWNNSSPKQIWNMMLEAYILLALFDAPARNIGFTSIQLNNSVQALGIRPRDVKQFAANEWDNFAENNIWFLSEHIIIAREISDKCWTFYNHLHQFQSTAFLSAEIGEWVESFVREFRRETGWNDTAHRNSRQIVSARWNSSRALYHIFSILSNRKGMTRVSSFWDGCDDFTSETRS